MSSKNTVNQINEYKKLASKMDHVQNPKGLTKPLIRFTASACLFLLNCCFAAILFFKMLGEEIWKGPEISTFEVFIYLFFMSLSFVLCNLAVYLKTFNYYKMKKISRKIGNDFINIEISEIFDMNCHFTKNIFKINKELLLKSYSDNNSLKGKIILSLIDAIEYDKQWNTENKKAQMKKFLQKNKIKETCKILQHANTLNSKNISLINSIGA